MRFLFCNFSNTYGGQEKSLDNLATSLTKTHGATCDFLGGPDRLARSTAFAQTYPMEPRFVVGRARRRALVRLRNNYAAVVLNGNRALYQQALGTFCDGSPVVYIQHSMLVDRQATTLRRLIRRLALPYLLRNTDAIIAVSRSVLPFDGKKIFCIPQGISLQSFKPRPHPVRHVKKMIMVGSLVDNKNQALAIRSLPHVPDVSLTLVGEGPNEESLRNLARELEVHRRVEFRGFVDSPGEIYREADLFLLLSRFEGMPLAVLEAMATALPVIATRAGGVPEVIRDGVDGLLITQGASPIELAERIRYLCRNPQKAFELAASARSRVESEFSLTKMIDSYWSVLADVAANRVT